MITPQTISAIIDAARIDEVVGEFVSLKKRGVNYIGLCPFHNEKTPSFNVNPARNIFKCFGCGKGGDAVKFIMEHEHYTYPEALKFLAKKYNIAIEEAEQTPEMIQEENERESLYIVSAFAEQFFIDNLHNTDEGKSIGLSYFKERGFTDVTIQKFKLGYSPDKWDALLKAAIDKGYKLEYLQKTGLVKAKSGIQNSEFGDEKIKPEDDKTSNSKRSPNSELRTTNYYDGFRGRVMFPIHNLSGRVIGFGGRVLRKDEKTAKYINTPECEIYHKSKTLYGIFYAKKSIIENDNCFLVEGYTDVISLHQSGIENAVASSGTSLTQEQIRLIGRYTKNITILYDGDAAGIKASFRGIDMILEEGMNVKAALFPDGEDPDSFSKKVSNTELAKFIAENSKDFIVFKTNLLKKDAENDPIKKSQMIHEIVSSIALIPDHITRSIYVKECGKLMEISEKALIAELNKYRRKKFANQNNAEEESTQIFTEEKTFSEPYFKEETLFYQEQDIVRLLLNYGDKKILVENYDDENNITQTEISIADFIVHELKEKDDLSFETPVLREIFEEFYAAFKNEKILTAQNFINHSNEEIKNLAIELLTTKYELHNWKGKNILVSDESQNLKRAVNGAVLSFKTKKLNQLIEETRQQIKTSAENGEDLSALLERQKNLEEVKKLLGKELGRVILK